MSQHPQQIVHYAPLAPSATKDDVTKQNGMPVIIDDDDDGDSDDGAHKTNHNRPKRSFTSLRRSTSGHGGSRSRSRRSGSLTHVYDVDDECTGLIAPNGMEVPLATVDQKRRKWWRDALINLGFIAGWFLFATLLSVYNKWMFSPDRFAFPYPLFITSLHMLVQFVLAGILRYSLPAHFKPENNPNPRDYVTKAIPTGATTAMDIGLSNLSLKFITLSFYTMCKSSSLIFVLFFAFLFHLEAFSWRLVFVITLISAGVILMVATETAFHFAGMFMVFSASALGGLRWSLTQILLRKRNMGMDTPVATVYWLAPVMGLTLAFVSMAVEGWGNVFRLPVWEPERIVRTLGLIIAPGILAFAMVLSEYYIIKRAGVVPMSIAGIFKEVTTIMVSAWVFGDELTPLNVLGVGITFIGIGLYTHHKYQKALHSPVPLDPHGNPLPQEEAEEILQTAVRLDFPPEEGFIGGDAEQYASPDEDEGYERERRDGVEPHIEGDGGLLPRHERQ